MIPSCFLCRNSTAYAVPIVFLRFIRIIKLERMTETISAFYHGNAIVTKEEETVYDSPEQRNILREYERGVQAKALSGRICV